jgi:hypothetical protein
MEDFIYLEVDEEITSIIDRLKKSNAHKIGIVIPRGAMVLQSVVNLKLIQNEAKKTKKSVAIITVDKVGRSLAVQVGLPVYDDPKQIESAAEGTEQMEEKADKAQDVIEIDMRDQEDQIPEGVNVHYYTGEDAPEGEEAKAETPAKEEPVKPKAHSSVFQAKKIGLPKARPQAAKPSRRKAKIIASIIAIIIIAVGAWVMFSKAQVTLTVPADAYEAKGEVKVDATLMASDPDQGKIKGTLIEANKEVSRDIKATGTKKVGDKAHGTVSFYNDAGVDQQLSAGTSVTSSGGKKFTLDSAITVPKASLDAGGSKVQGKADGKITAGESGTDYNLSSTTSYTVSGSNYISGKGETSGGTSRELTIVSKNDINEAKDRLTSEPPSEIKDSIKSKAQGGYVIDSAINFSASDFSTSKKEGDEASSFTAKAKLVGQVIVFDTNDLRNAVAKAAQKDVPAGKSLLFTEDDEVTPNVKSIDLPKKEMVLDAILKAHVGNAVDTSKLSTSIKGKTVKRARELIAAKTNLSANDVSITIRPNTGLVMLPYLTKNIKFKLEYKPSSSANQPSSSSSSTTTSTSTTQ